MTSSLLSLVKLNVKAAVSLENLRRALVKLLSPNVYQISVSVI